ncbi:SDR family oxidoreductase [Leucobacter rhizosphaerae]|uniref:SDR family oxidoreductase n=1 Tax=Leucobacter rhizosphaerae TaxID=2932245 RepID=A0ABY4FSF4_9MICO|nr:SDR family oxidoreductase [Leucobacter rhizosphaerae]UOQ59226.1 SDR family oxidoreductase [Leucobacter rhizosphaerae]
MASAAAPRTASTCRRLDGQVAIVTGASRGIGLATAARLIDEGASVCITARSADGLEQALARLPEGKAIARAGKADDPAHRAEVLDAVHRRFGRLDVLVNAAGANPAYGPLADLEHGAARKTLEVNVLAALAWVQDAVRHDGLGFRERRGRVVNISSSTAETPSPGIGLYGVAKAALSHLTRTMAAELGPEIRVNAVAPAVVRTQFAAALYEANEAEVAARYPLGRLGEPEDVAAAIAYFASSDSSWVSGQVLTLDGGLSTVGGTA